VPYLQVPSFLAPLSIRKIPMVGEKTFHLLRSMGIATIATLQEIPAEMMVNVLGSHGLVIWKRAHGIDHTPVEPWSDRKSVGAEITFEQDTTNIGRLHEILSGMVEKLAFQLRKETWLASCVTVKIRYANSTPTPASSGLHIRPLTTSLLRWCIPFSTAFMNAACASGLSE
jgi:DNA polymerase-4